MVHSSQENFRFGLQIELDKDPQAEMEKKKQKKQRNHYVYKNKSSFSVQTYCKCSPPVSCLCYSLLCALHERPRKEYPKALTLCLHPWFGLTRAFCQLSWHSTAWTSSPCTPPAPLVLVPAPQLPFMACAHSAVTK